VVWSTAKKWKCQRLDDTKCGAQWAKSYVPACQWFSLNLLFIFLYFLDFYYSYIKESTVSFLDNSFLILLEFWYWSTHCDGSLKPHKLRLLALIVSMCRLGIGSHVLEHLLDLSHLSVPVLLVRLHCFRFHYCLSQSTSSTPNSR